MREPLNEQLACPDSPVLVVEPEEGGEFETLEADDTVTEHRYEQRLVQ